MTSGPLPGIADFVSYNFDARNRLTSVNGISYAYDAEGNRISQTDTNGTTYYLIDTVSALPRVLSRTLPDGSTTHYIYGVCLAYQINSDGSTHTHHYDHLGNTIAITDDQGEVTDRIEYSPYGIVTHREGTTDTPFPLRSTWSPNRLQRTPLYAGEVLQPDHPQIHQCRPDPI